MYLCVDVVTMIDNNQLHCLKDIFIFYQVYNATTPILEWLIIDCLLSLHRGYQMEDGLAILPVNTAVQGDVTVYVYHARSTFGGKVQGKVRARTHCRMIV